MSNKFSCCTALLFTNFIQRRGYEIIKMRNVLKIKVKSKIYRLSQYLTKNHFAYLLIFRLSDSTDGYNFLRSQPPLVRCQEKMSNKGT